MDIFLCLDSFRSAVHNITKNSNGLEAWMTFLSATEPERIHMLIEALLEFASIYQEITDFVKDPGELITMLSKELYIMDRNLERLMVEEAQEEAANAKAELDATKAELDVAVVNLDHAVAERDIFKLKCKNKTSEEIAEELQLSVEYVNRVLEAE